MFDKGIDAIVEVELAEFALVVVARLPRQLNKHSRARFSCLFDTLCCIVCATKVLGRDLALFSVVTAFPPVRDSPWVLLMFTAWATSEVIRYTTN